MNIEYVEHCRFQSAQKDWEDCISMIASAKISFIRKRVSWNAWFDLIQGCLNRIWFKADWIWFGVVICCNSNLQVLLLNIVRLIIQAFRRSKISSEIVPDTFWFSGRRLLECCVFSNSSIAKYFLQPSSNYIHPEYPQPCPNQYLSLILLPHVRLSFLTRSSGFIIWVPRWGLHPLMMEFVSSLRFKPPNTRCIPTLKLPNTDFGMISSLCFLKHPTILHCGDWQMDAP